MRENLTGLVKIIGIVVLLFVLWGALAWSVPDSFLKAGNLENLMRRTALFGILGIGVAFVIMTGGIDLSIGSLVCLCACLFAMFLQVDYRPFEESPVWEIQTEGIVIVDANREWMPGDTVHYYGGRRAHRLMGTIQDVRKVRFQNRPAYELQLDTEFSRVDQVDAEQREVGRIARMRAIVEIDDHDDGFFLSLDDQAPPLAVRDRLWMLHPQLGRIDDVVTGMHSSDSGRSYQLKNHSPLVQLDWWAIAVRRVQRMSLPWAVLAVLGIAGGLGLLHALLVTHLNQRPFVVTLCGLLIYRGLARQLSGDQTVGGFSNEYADSLGHLQTGKLTLWTWGEGAESFGIPYVFFILLLVAIAAAVVLNLTIWGRYILALGKNQEAARYAGINTGRMIVVAYLLCAVLTGLGGILHGVDANSISPSSFGNFFELYAIAAAVLGGCSLRGGEGSILGVVVGTALMQTLNNSITLLRIPKELEYVIIGGVILVGIVSDELIRLVAARWRRGLSLTSR
ncbi:MAG TPA: hypothetical protein PKD54_02790 [Pirellulaceae bacterium]|nr:hypothetical protein [Pirellulaceae bacterium]